MEWISVKDGLPEPHQDINVKLVDGTIINNVFKAMWTDAYYCIDTDEGIYNHAVVEWQPLEQD